MSLITWTEERQLLSDLSAYLCESAPAAGTIMILGVSRAPRFFDKMVPSFYMDPLEGTMKFELDLLSSSKKGFFFFSHKFLTLILPY